MSDDRGSASGVILSFLLGGLTGAALATLFAPRAGHETREMLHERFREGRDRGREFGERAVERGRGILEDAEKYVERQRDAVTSRKDRVAAAVEAGKQAYREEKRGQDS